MVRVVVVGAGEGVSEFFLLRRPTIIRLRPPQIVDVLCSAKDGPNSAPRTAPVRDNRKNYTPPPRLYVLQIRCALWVGGDSVVGI